MTTRDEIIVGAGGHIYTADADVATAPTTALPADLGIEWTNMGVVSEAGCQFEDSRTITDIEQWNGFYPVRKLVTARDTKVSFNLRQWNEDTIPFALGGGSFATGTYTPPAAADIPEWSLAVTWRDGLNDFLLYIARGVVSGSVSFSLVKDANAELPVEFSVLGVNEGDQDSPYLLLTDSAIFSSETES